MKLFRRFAKSIKKSIPMNPEKALLRNIKAAHFTNFRRYIKLEGGYGGIDEYLSMNCFELRDYLEERWLEGMDWEGYGSFWVVDHIVPIRYFDLRKFNEAKLCWHHVNLLPVYYHDNHAKGYCLEVSKKILASMPQCATVGRLLNKVEASLNMFDCYY